jgi:hypothetical protein
MEADSGRVYDAIAIDAYIKHLHTRIAALNDQLHDAHERTKRAEARARGQAVDELEPAPTTTNQEKVRRVLASPPPPPPPSVVFPAGNTDVHDEFWFRDGHLDSLEENDVFLGELRAPAQPVPDPPARRRRRFARG